MLDGAELSPSPALLGAQSGPITWFPFERGKWSPGERRVHFFIKLLNLALKFTDQLLCPLAPCFHCFAVPHPVLAGISCRKGNILALELGLLDTHNPPVPPTYANLYSIPLY